MNNNTPVDTRSHTPRPVPREDSRPHARPDESQRRAFEKLLSEEEEETGTEVGVDGGVMVRPFLLKEESLLSAEENLAAAPAMGIDTPVAGESPVDIQIPAPVFPPAPVQQASLYPHLALPHGQPADMGHFEVLDGSLVSGVEVHAGAQGRITVTVGTSVQHASLLDRYLPQLQRRLPEKVSAHVRVQERDQRRD